MPILDGGSSTTNKANVTSTFDLQVRTPTSEAAVGFVGLLGLLDLGASRVDSAVPSTRRLRVSRNNRLAIGHTTVVFSDSFNATATNSGIWRAPVTTQTVAQAGGFLTLNSGANAAVSTISAYQSYRNVPLVGMSEIHFDLSGYQTVNQVNQVTEFGLFAAGTLPNTTAPTDGVFFRYNASNELRGVINYAGVETQTNTIAAPAINVIHLYRIVITEEHVEFWIDGTMRADIDLKTTIPGQGQPFQSTALPITLRLYNHTVAPASGGQFRVAEVNVAWTDVLTSKPWSAQMASLGLFGYQGQNGGTIGSTALYTNSLAPGAGAAMTNTTAALGSGLGGQFTAQPTLAASTDGIISSFQVPLGTVNQTPRTLIVSGGYIQGIVSAALTGGPVLNVYSVAFGHTAVSLATANGATTKAPRVIPVGIETFVVTAPVGTLGQGVRFTLDTPIAVNPGEFIQFCAKNIGTVTSAGTITYACFFDCHWE